MAFCVIQRVSSLITTCTFSECSGVLYNMNAISFGIFAKFSAKILKIFDIRKSFVEKRLSFFCNSPEIGFCKALIICDLDGRLLLQGMEYREGEIAKEVAMALIFVADFVFCGVTKSYFYNQKNKKNDYCFIVLCTPKSMYSRLISKLI